MRWLVVSLLASVVLTVIVNAAIRLVPDLGRRTAGRLAELASPRTGNSARGDQRSSVFFPWKAMLATSVVLTIAVNAVIWIT